MKTHTNLILYGLLFSLLFGAAYAQSAQSGALSLTNVAVTPSPVVAGKNMTVFFQLYNSYDSTLYDVNLQMAGAYPLLNFSPSHSYLISTMGNGLYTGYFFYNISVPASIPSGTYALNFIATYRTTTLASATVIGTSTMPLSIYVHGIPNVTAGVTGAQITSGNTMVVNVRIANTGYSKAENLVLGFLNTSRLSTSGTSSFSIAELLNRSSINVSVTYSVAGGINSGTYFLPISVSYASGYNTTYSKQLNLTASIIINNPNIKAIVASSQPLALYQGHNQSLQIGIENTGLGAAKSLNVSILPGAGVTLLSSVTNFFIADLEPNQIVYEPVLITSNSTANASLVASMSYYSSNYQNQFSSRQTLSLSSVPAAQFSVSSTGAVLPPGAAGIPVRFRVTNTGTSEARQIQLSLQTTYPITPVASTSYISTLAPGSSTNATFVVTVDSQGTTGNYPVTLYEQWKQPNGAVNQQFSGSNNYFISVGSSESGSTTAIIGAVVVIAAIVGIVMYRRRASTAKQKREKAK